MCVELGLELQITKYIIHKGRVRLVSQLGVPLFPCELPLA